MSKDSKKKVARNELAKDAEIARLSREVASKDFAIDLLTKDVESRDREIEGYVSERAQLREANANQANEIDRLSVDLRTANETLTNLRNALSMREPNDKVTSRPGWDRSL